MSALGLRLITWTLMAMAIMFTVSLFVALIAVLLLTSLWSLLCGRKPEVAVWWTRYRDMTRRMTTGGSWSSQRPQGRTAGDDTNVVDVQAREVRDAPRQLPPQD